MKSDNIMCWDNDRHVDSKMDRKIMLKYRNIDDEVDSDVDNEIGIGDGEYF